MDRLVKHLLIGSLICLIIAFGLSLYYEEWARAITNAIWIMIALCTIHIDKALNNNKKTIKMLANDIEYYKKVNIRLCDIVYDITQLIAKVEEKQAENELDEKEAKRKKIAEYE